jgi:hypothetical protein
MQMSWKKILFDPQEDKLRDKPGYEHLNEPLHVLVEAEFPADIVDGRLSQAVSILEDLLKPIVCTLIPLCWHSTI